MSEQPLPIKNNHPFVVDELTAELNARKDKGIVTYGVALQPFNNRDVIRDLKEEILDSLVYLKQFEMERNELIRFLHRIKYLEFDSFEDLREKSEELLKKFGEQ